ncbi:hypothetical protein D1B33_15160 [Lysinibacillus yapensis]|uniref:Uncharacterized protein n=1 Tax=Ureibacillus yapensis TaxID=2304605 RepID=A0A396SBL8_9BACL|nr:hypothetical protein [Lysinibacillus yapensis]RHW33385.1 hypothetical protein D1B33_15160 [Lysinibacillus yapensis]
MDSPEINDSNPKVFLNRHIENLANQDSYFSSDKEEKIGEQLKELLDKQLRIEHSLIKFHQVITHLMLNSKSATNILSGHLKMLQHAINRESNASAHNGELIKKLRNTSHSNTLKAVYVSGQPIAVCSLLDLDEHRRSATFLTPKNNMVVIDLAQINGVEFEQ